MVLRRHIVFHTLTVTPRCPSNHSRAAAEPFGYDAAMATSPRELPERARLQSQDTPTILVRDCCHSDRRHLQCESR